MTVYLFDVDVTPFVKEVTGTTLRFKNGAGFSHYGHPYCCGAKLLGEFRWDDGAYDENLTGVLKALTKSQYSIQVTLVEKQDETEDDERVTQEEVINYFLESGWIIVSRWVNPNTKNTCVLIVNKGV